MTNYAVIQNNKVINIIVADTKEIAEAATNTLCVEATHGVGIDHTWDGTNFIGPNSIIEGEIVSPAIEG